MIPIKFVKPVADTIVGPLIAVINKYIRKSYFPNAWKQARISSIPKVDLPTAEEHFRPISILLLLSRVFERRVARHVSYYCEHEATLKHTISGFR